MECEVVRSRGAGHWTARCPSHPDRSPSLSIHEGERGILLRCFAGCSLDEICRALNISQRDLFFDALVSRGQQSVPRAPRVNPVERAFQFDLAALDRRIRSETVLARATNIDPNTLSDDQLDRLMTAVASAYHDRERAELLEELADSLRWKDWQVREQKRHAA